MGQKKQKLFITQDQATINNAIDYLGVHIHSGEAAKVFDKETAEMLAEIIREYEDMNIETKRLKCDYIERAMRLADELGYADDKKEIWVDGYKKGFLNGGERKVVVYKLNEDGTYE